MWSVHPTAAVQTRVLVHPEPQSRPRPHASPPAAVPCPGHQVLSRDLSSAHTIHRMRGGRGLLPRARGQALQGGLITVGICGPRGPQSLAVSHGPSPQLHPLTSGQALTVWSGSVPTYHGGEQLLVSRGAVAPTRTWVPIDAGGKVLILMSVERVVWPGASTTVRTPPASLPQGLHLAGCPLSRPLLGCVVSPDSRLDPRNGLLMRSWGCSVPRQREGLLRCGFPGVSPGLC